MLHQIDSQNIITDKTENNLVRVTAENWRHFFILFITSEVVYNHMDHSFIPYPRG